MPLHLGRGPALIHKDSLVHYDYALTAALERPDTDLAAANLNRATGLLEKRPKPSGRLVVPGPHEYTPVHDDGPDPDEAVFGAAANLQVVRVVDRRQEFP